MTKGVWSLRADNYHHKVVHNMVQVWCMTSSSRGMTIQISMFNTLHTLCINSEAMFPYCGRHRNVHLHIYRVYIYIYIHIHIHIHTYVRCLCIYIYMYVDPPKHTYNINVFNDSLYIYIYIHTRTRTYVHMVLRVRSGNTACACRLGSRNPKQARKSFPLSAAAIQGLPQGSVVHVVVFTVEPL